MSATERPTATRLRALALVDPHAIEANVGRLRSHLRRGTRFCAVVKADGYGHGALAAARAALAAGAETLAVAGAAEAAALRAGGVEAPVLVMGALSEDELRVALQARAEVVVWRERDLAAVAAAGGGRVHVKLDTG
ncbi:MAG: alanine racemase, partial [Solirubrobacteraceae bacterium]